MSRLVAKEIRCPFCKARLSVYERSCPHCQGDLSLLSDLHLLAYALFNDGLALYAQGDYAAALIKFAAAVEWDPALSDAHRMLARTAESVSPAELSARHEQLAAPA